MKNEQEEIYVDGTWAVKPGNIWFSADSEELEFKLMQQNLINGKFNIFGHCQQQNLNHDA